MFVDSDDVLLPNAIECLLSKAYLEDADIVEGNGYRFDKNGFLGKKSILGRPLFKGDESKTVGRIEISGGLLV